MADLARYIRIYDPAPDDDLVGKREASAKEVVSALRKINGVAQLVAIGDAVAQSFAGSSVPEPLGSIVATAIRNKAPSFVREERELEVSVVAAASIMELFDLPENGNIVASKDIIASTVWSALSFQQPCADPKHDQLRQNLLELTRARCLSRAEVSRRRSPPKDVPEFAEGDLAQVAKSLAAAAAAVKSLTVNAVLDREEIDILWWAHGGRSPTTRERYEDLPPIVHGVLRGVELGSMSRRLPSQSMRSLALSGVPATEPMTLTQVIGAAQPSLDALIRGVRGGAVVNAHPTVFPLLSSLLSGNAVSDGAAKSVDEWCGRAVLEAGIASICDTPVAKV